LQYKQHGEVKLDDEGGMVEETFRGQIVSFKAADFKIPNKILKCSAGYHRPEQGDKGRVDGITLRDRKQRNARVESGKSNEAA